MKPIRVAIIGQGRSGRDIHGVYLKTDPRFRIVAAVDFLEDRRRRAAEEYQCDVTEDYRTLLGRKDLDLVVNAAFSHRHPAITLDCLRAGYHVLCEKPLAGRVRDVDAMVRAAKKAKRILAIFQQSRYAPYFLQVQEVIRSGVLGRIVQVAIQFNGFARRWDWQTLQSYRGGNLLNTGPHPLDQALVLFGDGRPRVTCFMDRTEGCLGDAENHVKLLLTGAGHPLIDIEISSVCAYPSFTYHVYGSRGGLKGSSTSMEWRYFLPGEAPEQKLTEIPLRGPDGTPRYPAEELKWHTGSWPTADGPADQKAGYSAATAAQANLTQAYYDMLYRTLTGGAPLEITPEQVRRQIAVIEECHRQNPRIYRKSR